MYLVTGGCGLLGRSLVIRLLEQGRRVRVLDLRAHPDARAESVVGDIREKAVVEYAMQGVDTVFHCASLVNLQPGRPPILYDVNVRGTEHVIEAARAAGVRRLIYTSSQDVVFGGADIRDGDESLPYPPTYLDYYGETKAIAERRVLQANGIDGMLTCVLRPTGIYGPYDNQRFPPVLRQAMAGKMMRMGSPDKVFSHVFAENVAYAHLLAADCLTDGSPAAGSVYFITDSEAVNFFDFFTPYFEALGIPVPSRSLPFPLVLTAATMMEWGWRLMPHGQTASPLITRYVAHSVCRDFSFVSEKARRDFGYTPVVDEMTARQRTIAWLKDEWLPQEKARTFS